jgi:TRAP-type mannitol/chloroaromatic compound transport system permease large subunit
MTLANTLDLLMFAALCGLMIAGFPVAFTLGGTALLFAGFGALLGVLDVQFLQAMPQRIFGVMTNETLIAVPLFIFMGVMLERSRVAGELLEAMGRLFGNLRGGLGISVSVVGALLAASTGIVGATVVTMGLLSLPTMLRRGYDPALACGSIAAAGTLGQIIPPSIVLVLLGDVLSSAYQQAQLAQGIFSPKTISVGDLFAGALIPGLVLVGFYVLYQVLMAWLRPRSSPAVPAAEAAPSGRGAFWRNMIKALFAPALLIIAVLGSILAGIATPTEAAAVGAVGALLLAASRPEAGSPLPIYLTGGGAAAVLVLAAVADLRVARAVIPAGDMIAIGAAILLCAAVAAGIAISLRRVLRNGVLVEAMRSTARMTSMVFVVLIGAALFSLVFRAFGGDHTVQALLTDMPGGAAGAMVTVMLVMFLLGFFLDFIEIVFVVVPVVAPILMMLGLDPVWIGVMMAVNLQTSFLTPPFGFALFYLRGVAPDTVKTSDIYRGVAPFIVIQIFALAVLALFPDLATWLPKAVFGE